MKLIFYRVVVVVVVDILKQALFHTKSILFVLSQNESHYHVILSLPSATNHCVDVIVVC